ncbi:hypothetical protein Fraau_1511 [Frateuria aurantia DSM 6220]|uniref:Uncharacterized protein n=1 Tax=Frateuria aurantia (strain ATCC 33424 / DSM 6220 / KCTC 2777 / LMG 1558 / NBRC 3245 / NCIMB 13370) TaxID=767434 RepID=H8L685_FRAAD|nr:hypothetical protein Fraau_1511 [Frateuria aurantia DSM 6220]
MSSIASIIRELRIARKELRPADFVFGVLIPTMVLALIRKGSVLYHLITIAGQVAAVAA